MTYTLTPGTPKAASATSFGRELVKAYETRGIPRTEIHRVTGIGRTALANYRTGSSLPRIETAAQLAALLDWPKLRAIVVAARTRSCARCGSPFTNDGGNMGAKRYCSNACRGIADSERIASRRTRQAGQTDDGRRRYQAMARLRSGIRIAEGRAAELQVAIAAMCAGCEPEGLCRTADCPLRGFSPFPLDRHPQRREPRSNEQVRADGWTPERRAALSAMTTRLHAEGRMLVPRERHPAHDPLRRAGWIASIRATKARRRRGTQSHDGGSRRSPISS